MAERDEIAVDQGFAAVVAQPVTVRSGYVTSGRFEQSLAGSRIPL
jgi:hypothetical protein